MTSTVSSSRVEKLGPLFVVAGTFLTYLIAGNVVAAFAGQNFGGLMLTPEIATAPGTMPAVLLTGLSGVAIALVVPAIPWVFATSARALRAPEVFFRSFAVNLIQATAFISLCKAVSGEAPSLPIFLAWQAAVSVSGLVIRWRVQRECPAYRLNNRWSVVLVVIVVLILLPLLLWGKTFVEDGSGDGTEAFEFARALTTHQLPYWDLENGSYGFYPQFMLFAYPIQLSSILVGMNEAAQRLPLYFYVLGIVLVVAEFIRRRRRHLSLIEHMLLLGAAAYFVIYHSEHSSYELVSDLAQPTGVDVFSGFLGATACYALINRQYVWWGLYAGLGCMALAAGLPFALLLLTGHALRKRLVANRNVLRDKVIAATSFVAPLVCYYLLVAWYTRLHPMGPSKWSVGTFTDRYVPALSIGATFDVLVAFLWSAAVLPVVGLLFVSRRDPILRLLAVLVVGYLVILALFGRTHPHYLIPLSIIPAAMLLRGLASRQLSARTRQAGHALYAFGLVILLIALFPRDREVHTAYRDFGAQTLMLSDSYPGVVEATKQVLLLRRELAVHLGNGKPPFYRSRPGFTVRDWQSNGERYLGRSVPDAPTLPWGLSHHLWIRYADSVRVPDRQYLQVIAAPRLAPRDLEGFTRRELSNGWVLFTLPQSIFSSDSSQTTSATSVESPRSGAWSG